MKHWPQHKTQCYYMSYMEWERLSSIVLAPYEDATFELILHNRYDGPLPRIQDVRALTKLSYRHRNTEFKYGEIYVFGLILEARIIMRESNPEAMKAMATKLQGALNEELPSSLRYGDMFIISACIVLGDLLSRNNPEAAVGVGRKFLPLIESHDPER